MANKSNLGLKLVVVAVLLAAIVATVMFFLRPVAAVATVGKGPILNAVSGSVVVEVEKFVEIKGEVGGRLIQSELSPGKTVKEGDLLVQIDTGDIDLEIAQLNSEYKAKKNQFAVGSSIELDLATAQETLTSFERQTERGTYPKAELDKRRREVKVIEQKLELEKISNQLTLETEENNIKVKERQRDKMTLRAPFDGMVTAVLAHKGALVGSGERFATLITTSRLVEAKISEENFAMVQIGQRAKVRFLSYGDEQFDATVSEKLPTAEAATQRYIAYLKVNIPLDRLLPDLTGEVSIIVGSHNAEALVPRRAIADGFIFVVTSGRVERRRVKLGYTSLNSAEVLEGVKAGEQVIVDELDQYRDGDRVRVQAVN